MKRICYVVAMVAEAKPFIERYHIQEVKGFFAPLPCLLYEGEVDGVTLNVVLNGQEHGSDLIGCEAATMATLSAIQRLHPDIIINSGTCGGFRAKGAEIAKVYIGNGVMFQTAVCQATIPGPPRVWATTPFGKGARSWPSA